MARARLGLARGDADGAGGLQREAVDLAMRVGRTNAEARMREFMADVYAAQGDVESERNEVRTALDLYSNKEHVPGALRVSARLEHLGG
jgi:hypothetical protein